MKLQKVLLTHCILFIFQLNGTMFDNLVCPLFEIYSDMQQTLQILSEGDVKHHSVSVLTFVTERQIEALCRRVSIYSVH